MPEQNNFEILVIDDDKVISLLHKKLLTNHLQPPVPFSNGRLALEYLRTKNCSDNSFLLLLDLNMPILNGWDFLKELHKNSFRCSIHVILVTSSICTRDKQTAFEFEQVIGFCHKPLQVSHLDEIRILPELKHLFSKSKATVQ